MIRPAFHLAAALVAITLSASAVTAQTAPSHLEAARAVVVSSGMIASFEGVVPGFQAGIRERLSANAQVSADLNAVLIEMQPEMDLQQQAMVRRAAEVLAKHLTEAELREINAFFETPTGRRYMETQQVILGDLVQATEEWARDLAEYLQIRVRAEMLKRGHQL